MSTYYDLSHPSISRSRAPACEPPRPRYDPVTEASPRVPRVPAADQRPTERVTRQPSYGSPSTRSLPGLSELFASKLLVAPNARKDRNVPTCPFRASNDRIGNAAPTKLPSMRTDSVVSRQSPSRYTATPGLSSSVPTTPDSWTSELPPLQHGFPQSQQTIPQSPAYPSESFGSNMVGGHSASWTPDHNVSGHSYGLPPSYPNEEGLLHRVDSRAGWRESDLRPAMPELMPATYMYRTDCGMIAGPQSYPDCPVGFSVPGREDLVYPMWDLTKRKLPRKRMSTACTDCRKKKIRCEPGVGGCLQCRKAQKPCVIEPVKRRRRKKALASDANAEESDNDSEDLAKSS